MPDRDLQASIDQLAAAVRQLTAELRASREKTARTRRVKALTRARQVQDIPVSDIAAAGARRALARLRG